MQVAVPPENNQLALNQDERRQAIKLVMELRSASEKKRALIKDPTMGKVDYDAAQDEWNRIYKEIFEAIAKKKLLQHMQ